MQGLLSWGKGRPLFRCKRRQGVEGTVALTAATVNSTRSLGRTVAQVLYIREKHDRPASSSVVFSSGDPKIVPWGSETLGRRLDLSLPVHPCPSRETIASHFTSLEVTTKKKNIFSFSLVWGEANLLVKSKPKSIFIPSLL